MLHDLLILSGFLGAILFEEERRSEVQLVEFRHWRYRKSGFSREQSGWSRESNRGRLLCWAGLSEHAYALVALEDGQVVKVPWYEIKFKTEKKEPFQSGWLDVDPDAYREETHDRTL